MSFIKSRGGCCVGRPACPPCICPDLLQTAQSFNLGITCGGGPPGGGLAIVRTYNQPLVAGPGFGVVSGNTGLPVPSAVASASIAGNVLTLCFPTSTAPGDTYNIVGISTACLQAAKACPFSVAFGFGGD
jgi:hypothetical protein